MKRFSARLFSAATLLLGFACAVTASAQGPQGLDRDVLHSRNASPALMELVNRIGDMKNAKLPYDQLARETEYFVRIAPRRFTLTDKNEFRDDAILGTRPFVFLTTPQCIVGRSLLEIYEDIGYEAEDIIRYQRDQDMVAIIFKYEPDIAVSPIANGQLPENWTKFVFVPTWDNSFAILERLAANGSVDPNRQGEYAPERLNFRSEAERMFAQSFPQEGKDRIKTTPYIGLKATKGADWTYRRLLENKLGLFEHFRGNGRTHNEVLDPEGTNPEAGLFEFVGPNRKLKDLKEAAVVHLGGLSISDYRTRAVNAAPAK